MSQNNRKQLVRSLQQELSKHEFQKGKSQHVKFNKTLFCQILLSKTVGQHRVATFFRSVDSTIKFFKHSIKHTDCLSVDTVKLASYCLNTTFAGALNSIVKSKKDIKNVSGQTGN